MAESTLSITFSELKERVGLNLRYTRTSTNWTSEEAARVSDAIRDGLRKFYRARDWTFLKPARTVVTVANVKAYDLPQEVGYIEGNLYHAESTGYRTVHKAFPEVILDRHATSHTSGLPELYAMRPKMTDGVLGQTKEIIFWPTPDAAYTLTYSARILPDMLTTDQLYALGAAEHAPTILEACLSCADLNNNDAMGVHEAAYQQALANSIEYDARAYAPRVVGKLGNGRGRRISIIPPDLTLSVDQ